MLWLDIFKSKFSLKELKDLRKCTKDYKLSIEKEEQRKIKNFEFVTLDIIKGEIVLYFNEGDCSYDKSLSIAKFKYLYPYFWRGIVNIYKNEIVLLIDHPEIKTINDVKFVHYIYSSGKYAVTTSIDDYIWFLMENNDTTSHSSYMLTEDEIEELNNDPKASILNYRIDFFNNDMDVCFYTKKYIFMIPNDCVNVIEIPRI